MRTKLAAGVAALLTGAALTLAPSAMAADPKPGPTATVVKPPPVKPCRWMWFGNWQMCIRVP